MKTAKEFLTRGKGNFINCTDYDDAIVAMEEYAQQMAVEFHEWLRSYHDGIIKRVNELKSINSGKAKELWDSVAIKTTSELYQLFLTYKNSLK